MQGTVERGSSPSLGQDRPDRPDFRAGERLRRNSRTVSLERHHCDVADVFLTVGVDVQVEVNQVLAGCRKRALAVQSSARVVPVTGFLHRVNAGARPSMPDTVVVVGGGDVAMDACPGASTSRSSTAAARARLRRAYGVAVLSELDLPSVIANRILLGTGEEERFAVSEKDVRQIILSLNRWVRRLVAGGGFPMRTGLHCASCQFNPICVRGAEFPVAQGAFVRR